jgi:hypothetical protein
MSSRRQKQTGSGGAIRPGGVFVMCAAMVFVLSGAWLAASKIENSRGLRAEDEIRPIEVPDMYGENIITTAPQPFYIALNKALRKHSLNLESICSKNDPVARRVLEDYGAIFVAKHSVTPPPVCVFTSEAQVTEFQKKAGIKAAEIGDAEIELQPAAMKALLEARQDAVKQGLDITPRDGAEAARRSYDDTLRLWYTRVLPALDYWRDHGRLTAEQVEHVRGLPLHDQIIKVLELEKDGIFFSKDFSKSILYSIAAPGTSQHISMLAFDANEFGDQRVRTILAAHGWFQTVLSDLPHFTFLGLSEKDLPSHGLRPVLSGDQLFWIPNVPDSSATDGHADSPASK